MKKNKAEFIGDIEAVSAEIYLTIDHLKKGAYKFHIVENNKVIRTIRFEKK